MKHIRDNVYEHNGLKLCAIAIPQGMSAGVACRDCPRWSFMRYAIWL